MCFVAGFSYTSRAEEIGEAMMPKKLQKPTAVGAGSSAITVGGMVVHPAGRQPIPAT
jgi:hypothetical protein